jgi:hypothetical protein
MTDSSIDKNSENTKPADKKIVRAAIHPATGIARVGNSEEFYIGPETVRSKPKEPGFYKDGNGALKREAARFRIYGYNGAGQIVSEVTSDFADIEWTVQVANQKAAWYQFQLALDIPEASDPNLPPSKRRNANVMGADRKNLAIDPGPRTISGPNKSGDPYKFDTGEFYGTPVYLGELQTDDAGRLIFLGGMGLSASKQGENIPLTDFANNDGWHDDVSDGPVTATVSIGGEQVPVEPAWVITAPPNYAPDVIGVRTMYDLMQDVFVQSGMLAFPGEISFTNDIFPIFYRLSNMQWVNQGFSVQYGPEGRQNFYDLDYIARLASTDSELKEFRLQIYNSFRNYDRDGSAPMPWPWIYGDAMNVPPANTPREQVELSATQYLMLQLWAEGRFVNDWKPENLTAYIVFDKLPLTEQPAMLDRAALTYCLADAFHPGCEMTWPVRHASMYTAPFRIRHRQPAEGPEPDYGTQLTPQMVALTNGILFGQGPGTISRWMAVPWQTDTASCRSGYYAGYGPRYDPYVPTFWAARVPNQVLTQADYEIAVDAARPREERLRAFNRRAAWFRVLSSNYLKAITQMVTDFGKLGVVETRAGVENDPLLPASMLVESVPEFLGIEIIPHHRNLMMLHVEGADVEDKAGLESLESATAAAAEATGHDEEEFTVGFINKVNRFQRR